MRVLVVSEGKHEIGNEQDASASLLELVRRILPGAAQFESRRLSDRRLKLVTKMNGKGNVYEKRLLLWMKSAELEGFDALIAVADRDGDPRRQAGFDAAQEHVRFVIPRAFGLAVETFDAWMLGHHGALNAALGCPVDRPQNPEELEDAKSECIRLRDQAESGLSLTDVYLAVCRIANPDEIAKRCPKGFQPFLERLRLLAGRLAAEA